MRQPVKCEYCGAHLGDLHGNQRAPALRDHFKQQHPTEYTEIQEAEKATRELRRKYHYYGF